MRPHDHERHDGMVLLIQQASTALPAAGAALVTYQHHLYECILPHAQAQAVGQVGEYLSLMYPGPPPPPPPPGQTH
jgi:hypothetical protein